MVWKWKDKTAQERVAEMMRCKDLIGWSWNMVGDRLGLTLSQITLVRNLKLAVNDEDLFYLQRVAEAVGAISRTETPMPMVTAGEPTPGRPDAATGDFAPVTARTAAGESPAGDTDAFTPSSVAREIVTSIIETYSKMTAFPPDQWSEANSDGGRWALGELAELLGVLDEVKAGIAAVKAARAGQDGARDAAGWVPPGVAPRDEREAFEAAA